MQISPQRVQVKSPAHEAQHVIARQYGFDNWPALRPSAAVGDPAGAGVFLRPQRMRDLWRAPEDRRRPDRSGPIWRG